MYSLISTSFALASLITVTGCVSITPPSRPEYTGTDNIDQVQASQLIGRWSATELNPLPNTNPQTTFIDYNSDGTVSGIVPSSTDAPASIDNLELRLSGNWALQADVVEHRNIVIHSTDDSELGLLLNQVLQSQASISSRANIYEVSAERIVMVGEDGKAVEYLRQ